MGTVPADLELVAAALTSRTTGLRLNTSNRLVNGLYFEKRDTGKWVISFYKNVKKSWNDVEVAIDPRGLCHDGAEVALARAWFSAIGRELRARESGIHAPQLGDAVRLGLTLAGALALAEQLAQRLPDRSVRRWQLPADVAGVMLQTVRQTVAQSGKAATVVAKVKEFRFPSDEAFLSYVRGLLHTCGGRCSLTQVLLVEGDPDLCPSLDRINSDGHYEPGNIQIVARFANRWKSDTPDAQFRRLLVEVAAANTNA